MSKASSAVCVALPGASVSSRRVPTRVHLPAARPHRRVALEARAKAELHHLVAAADVCVLLDVAQLVPDRGGGGVAPLAQHGPARQHVVRVELEVLLDAVEHRAAAGVDAKVVDGGLEGGEVPLGRAPQQGPHNAQLLREGKHERAELRQVDLHRVARHLDDLLGEPDARRARAVLALEDGGVRLVVGDLRAHQVTEAVLCTPDERRLVCERDCGAAAAEERVLQEEGLLVAVVEGLGDELGRDDHRERAGVVLQQLRRQVDRQERGGAALAGEVEGAAVGAEAEPVGGHRAEGGGGREEGAVDDQEVHLLRLQARALEEPLQRRADDGLRLVPRRDHRLVLLLRWVLALQDAGRPRGRVAGARVAKHLGHELEVGLLVRLHRPPNVVHQLHELRLRLLPLFGRLKERKVEQVDRRLAPQQVRHQRGDRERPHPSAGVVEAGERGVTHAQRSRRLGRLLHSLARRLCVRLWRLDLGLDRPNVAVSDDCELASEREAGDPED
mmetsp:Transcript_406/g.1275  ORF Transcript_406/g.1275 Transcript_406/m.1275 type:complete len:501 (-) Transcript_406:163-1665(-)